MISDDVTLQQFHQDNDSIHESEISRISGILSQIIRKDDFLAFNHEVEPEYQTKYWRQIPYPTNLTLIKGRGKVILESIKWAVPL